MIYLSKSYFVLRDCYPPLALDQNFYLLIFMKCVLHKDTVLIYEGGLFYFVSFLKQTYFTSFAHDIVFCNDSYLRVRFDVTCQAISCNRQYWSLPVMTVMGRKKKIDVLFASLLPHTSTSEFKKLWKQGCWF